MFRRTTTIFPTQKEEDKEEARAVSRVRLAGTKSPNKTVQKDAQPVLCILLIDSKGILVQVQLYSWFPINNKSVIPYSVQCTLALCYVDPLTAFP